MQLQFQRDDWLSAVLGVTSWRALGVSGELSPELISRELEARVGSGGSFFSAKVPTCDVGAVAALTGAGFKVVDVNVTFEHDRAASGTDRGVWDVEIGVAAPDEFADIAEIAGCSFVYSRFHLDPAIGKVRADKIKREWAQNACRGRASTVYVARRAGAVCGFLAATESRGGGRHDAIIDLIGVDAKMRGRGVGRALSLAFVEGWQSRADRLRVGTQISNIPAMRLYESICFRAAETSFVLHAHLGAGVPQT